MADRRGRLYAGTSGFAYPTWVPRFYEPGKASRKLLTAYTRRLPAVELHTTFYRRPPPEQITSWLSQSPEHFRFCPKAQRGTSWRAWADEDPTEAFAWLTQSMRFFGERLGCILMSLRGSLERDDKQLQRVLGAWPMDTPMALELMHESWHVDEVHAALAPTGIALVADDWDDRVEPALPEFGAFVYLRLRRESYDEETIERWAGRLEPVLAGGRDAFVFFRHDDDGQMALNAVALLHAAGEIIEP